MSDADLIREWETLSRLLGWPHVRPVPPLDAAHELIADTLGLCSRLASRLSESLATAERVGEAEKAARALLDILDEGPGLTWGTVMVSSISRLDAAKWDLRRSLGYPRGEEIKGR